MAQAASNVSHESHHRSKHMKFTGEKSGQGAKVNESPSHDRQGMVIEDEDEDEDIVLRE